MNELVHSGFCDDCKQQKPHVTKVFIAEDDRHLCDECLEQRRQSLSGRKPSRVHYDEFGDLVK